MTPPLLAGVAGRIFTKHLLGFTLAIACLGLVAEAGESAPVPLEPRPGLSDGLRAVALRPHQPAVPLRGRLAVAAAHEAPRLR